MTQNNRRRFLAFGIILSIYVVATAMIATMAEIDYRRVREGQRPRFAGGGVGIADGGSVEFTGLLYRITDSHRYSTAPKPVGADGDGWAHDIGPELRFFFPALCPWWRNKDELRTVVTPPVPGQTMEWGPQPSVDSMQQNSVPFAHQSGLLPASTSPDYPSPRSPTDVLNSSE